MFSLQSLPIPEELGISSKCQGPVMFNFFIAVVGMIVLTAVAFVQSGGDNATAFTTLGVSIVASMVSMVIMTYAMGFLCLKGFKKATVFIMLVNALLYSGATAGLIAFYKK